MNSITGSTAIKLSFCGMSIDWKNVSANIALYILILASVVSFTPQTLRALDYRNRVKWFEITTNMTLDGFIIEF